MRAAGPPSACPRALLHPRPDRLFPPLACPCPADLIGLRLANNACFDPRAAEGLWRRMSAEEGAGPGVDMSFLSTHPSSKNRTRQVREWADES